MSSSSSTNSAYYLYVYLYGLKASLGSTQSDHVQSVLYTAIPSPIVSGAFATGYAFSTASSEFSDGFGPSSAPPWYSELPTDVQTALVTPSVYPASKFFVSSTTSSIPATTTESASPTTAPPPPPHQPALSGGAIAGIVIAVIAFLFLVALTTFLWGRLRGNRHRSASRSPSPSREVHPVIQQVFPAPIEHHHSASGSAPPYTAAKISPHPDIDTTASQPAELESPAEKSPTIRSPVSTQPDLHMSLNSDP